MGRGAVSGTVWLGRAVVFAVGLATILVLLFVAANAVLGTKGGSSLPGRSNSVGPIAGFAAVDQGLAVEPVARRRQIELPRGYAQVNVSPTTVTLSNAKGINGVQRSTTDNSVYCFDLKFVPKVAVGSAHINNNATVGTGLGNAVPAGCPTGFEDAAAKTRAANTSEDRSDINFGIVFI